MIATELPQPNHRILIIDDNEAIHEDLRKILVPDRSTASQLRDDEMLLFGSAPLELAEFAVDSAYQGQEGLERARQASAAGRPYAVAFVDIRMPPGWDGIETIARIREVDPHLQTVICTAYSDHSWSDIYRRLGHSDSLLILKKPFDNIEVIQMAYALSRKWLVTRQAEVRMADLDRMVAVRTAELEEARQRVQRELERRTAAQEAFQTIFQSGPFGIALFEAGACVDVNRAFEEYIARPKHEFVGKRIDDIAVRDRKIVEQCREELRTAGSVDAKEVVLQLQGIEPRTALIWVRPVAIQDRPHNLVFVLDISKRRQMEEELRRAWAAAEAAARAKSAFVANVSHEIRTPMNGILGFTQLALDGNPAPEQQEYLKAVEHSARALLGVINNILDFSKIDSGHLDVEHIPFSLRECMEAAVTTLSAEARRKNLALTMEAVSDIPDALLGDPGKLRQVFLNLLGNGLKFTEQGSVSLRATAEERSDRNVGLHFAVRDTGIGIAAAKQADLFQPFRQVDGSVTRKYGGTGLGLAISQKLVQTMGGRIWLESEAGQGAAFHFTGCFDLAQGRELPPPRKAPPGAARTAAPLSILVTDDNPINRKLATLLLRKSGHSAMTACNGIEAVALVRQHRFDLVLMDLQMPEMDGFQALAEIRRLEPSLGRHIPVVAMTAHAMEGERENCLRAGMDEYLSKPYEASDLLNLVSSVGRENQVKVRN
jgi:PAS domain S-box-containing protein